MRFVAVLHIVLLVVYVRMLALYSLGEMPVFCLNVKLKWDIESKQSLDAITEKGSPRRIHFFASSILSFISVR